MKIKDLVDILDQYNEKSEVTVSTSECLDDDFPLTKDGDQVGIYKLRAAEDDYIENKSVLEIIADC